MARAGFDYWLFDLDGTIVDVEESYPRVVFDEVGQRLGKQFTDEQVETLWYGIGDSRGRILEALDIDPEEFWRVFHDVEDPERRADHTFLYDDARIVGELDEPVGLVTHCQSYLTDPILDRLDIADWFDEIVCCTDETGWKPDPTPVEMVRRDLGVAHNGHEGVLIGDDPADVGAAWNAGLDAVYVRRVDPDERGQCVLGDYRVDSLATLRNGHFE